MESLNSHLQTAWCILAGIILLNVAAYFLNNKRSNVGLLILSLLLAYPPALIIASLTNIKRQAIKEMAIVEEFCKNIPRFKLNISPQELESNPIGLKRSIISITMNMNIKIMKNIFYIKMKDLNYYMQKVMGKEIGFYIIETEAV